MSAPRLCVSLAIHERPVQLLTWLAAWSAVLGDETVFVIHISRSIKDLYLKSFVEIGTMPCGVRFFINPTSIDTRWGSALPMHYINFRYAESALDGITHIMFATPSCLPIRYGILDRVRQFDVLGPVKLSPIKGWFWEKTCVEDPRLNALVSHFSLTEPVISRVENTTLPYGLAKDFFQSCSACFDLANFLSSDHIYPIEEVAIPMFLSASIKTASIGQTGTKIISETTDASVEQVQSAESIGENLSVKRISSLDRHPARKYIVDNMPGFSAFRKIYSHEVLEKLGLNADASSS